MSQSTFTPPPPPSSPSSPSQTQNNSTITSGNIYPKLSYVSRSNSSFVPPPPPKEFEVADKEKGYSTKDNTLPSVQSNTVDELPLETVDEIPMIEEQEVDEQPMNEEQGGGQILRSESQGNVADADKGDDKKHKKTKKKSIDDIVEGIPRYVKDKKEIKSILQPKNMIKMRVQSYDNGQMQVEAYEFFDENSPEKRYPIFLNENCKNRFKSEVAEKRNIEGVIVDWKDAKVECPLNRYCIKKGRTMYFISLKPAK